MYTQPSQFYLTRHMLIGLITFACMLYLSLPFLGCILVRARTVFTLFEQLYPIRGDIVHAVRGGPMEERMLRKTGGKKISTV